MPLDRALFAKMEGAGYLPELRKLAQLSAAPIWWYDDAATDPSILHNGTVCFVDVGSKIVGITAAHVIEKYQEDRRERGSVVCQLGNVRFDPIDRMISLESELDIATFAVSEVIVAASGCNVLRPLNWPPVELKPSDVVILGGYPGPLRKIMVSQVEFAFVTMINRVSQTSDSHGSVQLNLADSLWPGEMLGPGADLGGMSGGPTFRYVGQPIESLELAGFVYQYQESFEIVRVRHAKHVSTSGVVLP